MTVTIILNETRRVAIPCKHQNTQQISFGEVLKCLHGLDVSQHESNYSQ